MGLGDRFIGAYNAFLNRRQDPMPAAYLGQDITEFGAGQASSPIRHRYGFSGERTITASIYLRMALDCAMIDMRHVKLDEQDRYVEDVKSGMHECLNTEANIDQAGRAFLLDFYLTLFEGGDVAVLPVDMTITPTTGGAFDIQSWRVAQIVQWYPRHVRVEAYNDRTGRREQVTVDKRNIAIVQNPLHSVMNEPNSTLQRLIRKLALLDVTDEKNSSGKLDIIIQLPYPIRNEGRQMDAERRRRNIQEQLRDSTHGIAYIDATEKVTQLNRPAENNLLAQVEYLLGLLYTQLGLTPAVMNGTAEEAEMVNYMMRTIEPVTSALADELKRKFLTKTARTQGHSVLTFRDPFKLVPMAQLAELADKLTRNEIVTSNEFRGFIGMRPAKDPKADMLINSNLTVPQTQLPSGTDVNGNVVEGDVVEGEIVEDDEGEDYFAEVNAALDETFAEYGIEE